MVVLVLWRCCIYGKWGKGLGGERRGGGGGDGALWFLGFMGFGRGAR